MRSVQINKNESVSIHASSITCYLYEKEFDGRDIVDDFVAMGEVPNFGVLRRCLWAMMKTASPATVPGYAAWMNSTADIDYQMEGWMEGVTREVKDAFFRGAVEASEEEERQ